MNNQRGSMLIQVLIGAGIMTIVGLALASMIQSMWRESTDLQSKSNEMTLVQSLKQSVMTPELCLRNLGNKTLPSLGNQDLEITLNTGTVVKAGAKLDNWGLNVKTFKLTEVAQAMASLEGKTLYVGNMKIETQALSGKKMAYKSKEMGKLFLLVQDSGKNIQNCYATDSASGIAESVCRSMGGDFSPSSQVCDTSKILSKLGSCPGGYSVKGFNPDGSLKCVSTRPTSNCTYKTYDSQGFRQCGSGGFTPPANSSPCCPSGTTSFCRPISATPIGRTEREGFAQCNVSEIVNSCDCYPD